MRLKFLKKMIILGPKTAILGPQFCRILVLGRSGGPGPPGSAPGILREVYSVVLHCVHNLTVKIQIIT